MFLVAVSVAAVAQDAPLVTDRPDQTESTSIVALGRVQVETGWSAGEDEALGFRTRTQALFGTLVRFGLGGRFEGRLNFGGWLTEDVRPPIGPSFDESGIGDLDVGFKVKLHDGRAGLPDVALLGSLTLPTGAEPFQSRRVDPSVRVAFSNALTDRIGVGYNLGLDWITDCDPVVQDGCRDKMFTDAFYTLSFGFGLADRVGAFVEGFGTFGLDDTRPTHHSVDTGFTFLLRDNVQLDVSGGVGLNEEAGDWFAGAGISVRLPR